MTPALQKMWISIAAMFFMAISILLIYSSRYKFKGFMKGITAFFAYLLMIVSGIIIIFVVLSGPTNG
ncbi:DUF2768 domain-containing protein [Peribacillus kribbensis]|uniref:DUF2768 domain-containing protein n=1 Tax=Peribacillus kribbensis TaxID=356658 RepID=UPI00047D1858|nr:DUF2768 domain-containing protein [Peribacillus kribbensis]